LALIAKALLSEQRKRRNTFCASNMRKAFAAIIIVAYFCIASYCLVNYIAARPHLVGMIAALALVWIISALHRRREFHGGPLD
jgi:membrane associated rhomboid family serine protease